MVFSRFDRDLEWVYDEFRKGSGSVWFEEIEYVLFVSSGVCGTDIYGFRGSIIVMATLVRYFTAPDIRMGNPAVLKSLRNFIVNSRSLARLRRQNRLSQTAFALLPPSMRYRSSMQAPSCHGRISLWRLHRIISHPFPFQKYITTC